MVDFRLLDVWDPPGQKEVGLYIEGKQVGIISSGEHERTMEISFSKKVTTKKEIQEIVQTVKREKEYIIKIFIPKEE